MRRIKWPAFSGEAPNRLCLKCRLHERYTINCNHLHNCLRRLKDKESKDNEIKKQTKEGKKKISRSGT